MKTKKDSDDYTYADFKREAEASGWKFNNGEDGNEDQDTVNFEVTFHPKRVDKPKENEKMFNFIFPPRYFDVDGVLVKVEQEGNEVAGYTKDGNPYPPFKAIDEGREIPGEEFERGLK